MPTITPHLWYDTQAEDAAELYCSTFPDSKVTDVTTLKDTPSGDCPIVSFELFRQPFMAMSAGPLFAFNPSVSFLVRCDTEDEVETYWRTLSDGGTVAMPLGSYPFSRRYGWTQDRFGLSWQISLSDEPAGPRITPALLFGGALAGKAGDAIDLYTSVFPNSVVGDVLRYGDGEQPDAPGTVKFASFALDGNEFSAMDTAHEPSFAFNEAISFMIGCESQAEIDYYWERLSAVPEAEQCGWAKDRFGVSWQVTPTRLDEMLRDGTPEQVARIVQAFLPMKKLDLAVLDRAWRGE